MAGGTGLSGFSLQDEDPVGDPHPGGVAMKKWYFDIDGVLRKTPETILSLAGPGSRWRDYGNLVNDNRSVWEIIRNQGKEIASAPLYERMIALLRAVKAESTISLLTASKWDEAVSRAALALGDDLGVPVIEVSSVEDKWRAISQLPPGVVVEDHPGTVAWARTIGHKGLLVAQEYNQGLPSIDPDDPEV